jgi:hypothetical protein
LGKDAGSKGTLIYQKNQVSNYNIKNVSRSLLITNKNSKFLIIMEKVIRLNPTQETNILELATMIAKKANHNSNGEGKPSIPIAAREEKFTVQQPETISHHDELENAIEAIIHYIYKDVLKSYEEAEIAMNVNCDDEPLLCFHIFNEVDFVAKSLFPQVKFA